MKKLLLCACAFTSLAGGALAADLPARMPVKAPDYVPMFTWTGFYLGGNIGVGWTNGNATTTVAGIPGTISGSGSGVLGGGQIGYNWQTNSIVFGVETDIQASGGSGTANGVNGALTSTATGKTPWFGTIRGRLGYAPGRWMVYVTGGGVYGHSNVNGTTNIGVPFSASSDFWAWTVGAGVETALWDRWTGKLEYLYVGTPDRVPVPAGVAVTGGRANTSILRVGLNYHF